MGDVDAGAEQARRRRVGAGQAARQRERRRTSRATCCGSTACARSLPGHPFPPDDEQPWLHELEEALSLRGDARPVARHRRGQGATWSAPARWTAWSAATSATARPRSPCAPPSRPCWTSKQVAVLVPTTVLAQQHFNTFSERLKPFPVRVELLSRFRSEKEQKEVLTRPRRWRGGHRHRHASPAAEGCRLQEPRPARHRRGAALRRGAQGAAQAAAHRGGRADADARRRSRARCTWRWPTCAT